jgi:hypothetical protein
MGQFAATSLPQRWVATVSERGVRLVYGGGTLVIFR